MIELPKFTMDETGYTFYFNRNETLRSGAMIERLSYGNCLIQASRFDYQHFIEKFQKSVLFHPDANSVYWGQVLNATIDSGTNPVIAYFMIYEIQLICESALSDQEHIYEYVAHEVLQTAGLIDKILSSLMIESHGDSDLLSLIKWQDMRCYFIDTQNGKLDMAYSTPDILALFVLDAIQTRKHNIKIKRCENCGRYFIPTTRSDEKYCDFVFRNGKTCRQLGYEIKLNRDNILKEYRKIYKTQNARKQRNIKAKPDMQSIFEDRFSNWAKDAKQTLTQCQNGEISLETMKNIISKSDWLKNKGGLIYAEHNEKEE